MAQLGVNIDHVATLRQARRTYEPDPVAIRWARDRAAANGSHVRITNDANEAAEDADVIYTDVWTSMGYEDENQARLKAFKNWMVTDEMMQVAHPDALFMHCLPAHRGEEVSASVIDGPQSVVWDEAENRLHVQKALMEFLLCGRQ